MSLVGFTRIGEYTLPTLTGTHTDLPVLLKYADFDSTVLTKLDDGGGDLRFSSDIAGVTQIPCEVVSFDKVGTTAQIWVKVPSAATSTTVQVWGDNTGAAQPAVTDTFGRNAVWSDSHSVSHKNDATNIINSVNGELLASLSVDNQTDDDFLGGSVTSQGELSATVTPFDMKTTGSTYDVWINLTGAGLEKEFGDVFFKAGAIDLFTSTIKIESTRWNWYYPPTYVSDVSNWIKLSFVYESGVIHRYRNGLLEHSADFSSSSLYTTPSDLITDAAISYSDFTGQSTPHLISKDGIHKRALSAEFLLTEYENQSSVGAWGVMTSVAAGGLTMTLSEAMAATDTNTAKLSMATNIAEIVNIADSETGKLSTGFSISEAASPADSDDGQRATSAELIEAITSNDLVNDVLRTAITAQLSANASDLVTTLASYGLTISENIAAADSVSVPEEGVVTISISDVATAADNVSLSANFTMSLNESAAVFDSATSKAGFVASLLESINTTDSFSAAAPGSYTLTIGENASIIDSFRHGGLAGVITALITITPLISGNLTETPLISGTITVS